MSFQIMNRHQSEITIITMMFHMTSLLILKGLYTLLISIRRDKAIRISSLLVLISAQTPKNKENHQVKKESRRARIRSQRRVWLIEAILMIEKVRLNNKQPLKRNSFLLLILTISLHWFHHNQTSQLLIKTKKEEQLKNQLSKSLPILKRIQTVVANHQTLLIWRKEWELWCKHMGQTFKCKQALKFLILNCLLSYIPQQSPFNKTLENIWKK